MARRSKADSFSGTLKPADPFELIRWLARSQPDPRKALAELVQNSIDAGAREVHITRLRVRGVTGIVIRDDGAGVIPEMSRDEALRYIATHIGHSRKAQLTPEQRRELMLQGKYGIGLLGFWAIGQALEMRTQMAGEPSWVLRLHEDSPRFEVERVRSRLQLGERATEVTVRHLHRPAFSTLSGRRMAEYLAAELRGQLLGRGVRILVHDRIGRGRAPKDLEVRPARFQGQRLPLPEEIPVDGFAPIRAEIYLLPQGEESDLRVSVSAMGTLVYDDVCGFEAADFRRPPWTDHRLSGLLEFRDFQVPPGSRRGVLPDAAAQAFAAALRRCEGQVLAELEAVEARAAAALEADMLRQLQRVFRDLPRLAPEYDFFGIRDGEGEAARKTTPEGAGIAAEPPPSGEGMPQAAVAEEDRRESADQVDVSMAEEVEAQPSLLPAGPLAALHIRPSASRVVRQGTRALRVEARDAAGVRIERDLLLRWSSESGLVAVAATGPRTAEVRAGNELGTAIVRAVAAEDGLEVAAEAKVAVVIALDLDAERAGIPEPVFLNEPYAEWRSRMSSGSWEVNAGHPDFRHACESARRKLRYLAALLAKEVVLHSFPQPNLGPNLERLVSVLSLTERRLDRG